MRVDQHSGLHRAGSMPVCGLDVLATMINAEVAPPSMVVVTMRLADRHLFRKRAAAIMRAEGRVSRFDLTQIINHNTGRCPPTWPINTTSI